MPTPTRNKLTETFIVACLDSPDPLGDTNKPEYCLATSRIFTTRRQAQDYIKTIHPSRKPIIIAGDWPNLPSTLSSQRAASSRTYI